MSDIHFNEMEPADARLMRHIQRLCALAEYTNEEQVEGVMRHHPLANEYLWHELWKVELDPFALADDLVDVIANGIPGARVMLSEIPLAGD